MSVPVANKPHRKRLARRKPAKRPTVKEIHREEIILSRESVLLTGPVGFALCRRKHIGIDHRSAALLADKPFKLFECGKAPALSELLARLFDGDLDLLMIEPHHLTNARLAIPDLANGASEPFDPEPEIHDKMVACHEGGRLCLQGQHENHHYCQQTDPESRNQCHHHARLSRCPESTSALVWAKSENPNTSFGLVWLVAISVSVAPTKGRQRPRHLLV